MTETLERTLAPLMTIGGFCNLGMFEYPVGQLRSYISCLYALAKWSLLIYFFYYPSYTENFLIRKTIYMDDIVSSATIILILISICRFKELKTCLRELAIVDHTLEALGTPKEYQRLHNWITRIIIGWIVYVFWKFAYGYYVSLFYLEKDINFIAFVFWTYIVIVDNYPSNVIALSALISAAILGLVLYMCIHLLCKLFLLTLCVKSLQCETYKDFLVTYKEWKS
ncbi:hypothetical protein ALC57_13234 [Trachymyrmex cornetzi]|uniref:Gustatory receptor n=1 Tax=Trachymyrmex cornetzi TaxID=471704 RepID=A0A151IZM2_9HYME|nr:hypothetical protein ALC57_13234 [Trachymyrmex cornetzi]